MNTDELKTKLKEIIVPIITPMGVELDDIVLRRMKSRVLLKVVIDKESGVTIDDCARVSRDIEAILDVEDIITSSYVLEVSSPGLDRPLRTPEDFKKFSGKMARVITYERIENQTFFLGKLVEAGDANIVILLAKNKKVAIPYKDISKARLEVNF